MRKILIFLAIVNFSLSYANVADIQSDANSTVSSRGTILYRVCFSVPNRHDKLFIYPIQGLWFGPEVRRGELNAGCSETYSTQSRAAVGVGIKATEGWSAIYYKYADHYEYGGMVPEEQPHFSYDIVITFKDIIIKKEDCFFPRKFIYNYKLIKYHGVQRQPNSGRIIKDYDTWSCGVPFI